MWTPGKWLENDDRNYCDQCDNYPAAVEMGTDELLCGECGKPIGSGPTFDTDSERIDR